MNKSKANDWFMFGEWYGITWFHACYFEGLTKTVKKYVGIGLTQMVDELEGNVQRIYFLRSEWDKAGKKYLGMIVKNPKILADILSETREATDDLLRFIKKLKSLKIDKLSKKEQIKLLEEYHKAHHKIWILGQVPNVLELESTYLTDYLKSWLKKKLISKDVVSAFQVLVTPRELSKAQKQEKEMLGLALKKNPQKALSAHYEKYKWLHFGWTGPDLTLKYFEDVHAGFYKEGKSKERLKNLVAQHKKLLKNKSDLLKRLKPPSKITALFRLLEEMVFIKAYRMDALYMSYSTITPLLRKVAKDNYLSFDQVFALYLLWLIKMIKEDKFDTNWINQVCQYSVWDFNHNKSRFLVGEEARKVASEVKKFLPKSKAVKELKGETAYPGKAKGIVKIVNYAGEMQKFNAGDILVSNVTDPSLLPAMKKASAFVTNMGGLTCHAAIVARELRIPCVIGTKIATHVLKDGDTVEVDAEKGTVKKI